MPPTITYFPVGNGDMALIKLDDDEKTSILIDTNIRKDSEDEDDSTCDVAKELRDRLEEDENGRPYVDVFMLNHPDQDHCGGLKTHFHLDLLDNYNDDPPEGEDLKIVIREIWSSPMVFRRASKNATLCADAKAFNKEARRRVDLFKNNGIGDEGDRIKIIGEDEDGKTDDLEEILYKVDEKFSKVNEIEKDNISMLVLGPLPPQEDEEDEDKLAKNRSSIILQFSIEAGGKEDACLYLTGGDAEVYIWEKLWGKYKKDTSCLDYDLLLAPHHCSWHALSYDGWNGGKDDPELNDDAKSALSQIRSGGIIISSSNPIKNNENDPPCWGAKKEYESIVKGVDGTFYCTEEYPKEKSPKPLVIKIYKDGPQKPPKKSSSLGGKAVIAGSTSEPLYHG